MLHKYPWVHSQEAGKKKDMLQYFPPPDVEEFDKEKLQMQVILTL